MTRASTDMSDMRREAVRLERLSDFSVNRARDAIFWLDAEANIVRVNEAACQSLGYTNSELLTMTIPDIDADIPANAWSRHWSALKKKRHRVFISHQRKSNGSIFPVEVSENFIEFEGIEYSCSFVRDITDRITAELALKQALSEVEKLKNRLEAENVYLQEEISTTHNFKEIVTQNEVFRGTLRQVEKVAVTDTTVLILGETGTGKELVARALHSMSNRADRPLVKVNCATLPANLIENELFGSEKGAFTGSIARTQGRFELADGGTIFLDEIGDLPLELQAKLLRVLQEGEFERLGSSKTIRVDVRVIAATHRNLEDLIAKGIFRDDLFYRLNKFPVVCPSLRDRIDDIPLLVHHFVEVYGAQLGKKIDRIPKRTMHSLQTYHWPGNVRELENVIERAMILSPGGQLELGDWLQNSKTSSALFPARALEELSIQHQEDQKEAITRVLESTSWRVSGPNGAASVLGLKPTTLESRMKRLGIKRKRFSPKS
jgi:PAS domain S-box-containing protein